MPQRGCVAARGTDLAVPPAPGVRVVRVTRAAIEIAYDLGSDLLDCEPALVTIGVNVTISGLPPQVEGHKVSSTTGTLEVKPRRIRGAEDYGPADLLTLSSATESGLRSEVARVSVPPPEGESRLSNSQRRQIAARREACRANIDDRTSCSFRSLHPVSGPVQATPAQLTRAVRRKLEAMGGFSILRVQCASTRCDAAFETGGGDRLGMSYRLHALKGAERCWEVTGFSVTRPVPELDHTAAPFPGPGCVDR